VFPLFFAALALAGTSPATPPSLTADFAGDGRAATATARALGKSLRLEISDAAGKRLAFADTPAPAGSGETAIRLTGGSLGSPGSLLELAAEGAGEECRTIWRFHGGALARLPVRRGGETLPDCARPDGWTARWEKKSEDAPAVWVRERVRTMPRGAHHEREVFAFTGFALELDTRRSASEIGGVAIPVWNESVLYTRPALEVLSTRFDLSSFRSAPRLRLKTDRTGGVFELQFRDREGSFDAPVTAAGKGAEENEVALTIRSEKGPVGVRATLRGNIVSEVRVTGLSPRWDALYIPASRFTGGALEIYARAEDETAANYLVGLWTSEKGAQFALNLVPGVLGALVMGRSQLDLSLDQVPAGTDALLIPRDGSAPAWALTLKGGNGLSRVPVRCGGRNGESWSCQVAGPAETFHRIGGRMNAR
jgi:hypothetical protein